MKFLTRRFAKAPEGTAALFFIQIFSTLGFAVLYSTLVLYATKHLQSRRKDGHDVDGCVRRFQLRPAPVRRLPGRPFPFEPQSVCREHGGAGRRLRMHRDRHARVVLRRARPFPHRQRPQCHLHQHDAHAALYPGGSAPRRRFPLELRRHECRLLRRVQRRRLFPGDPELLEPLHLRHARQFRRHHPRPVLRGRRWPTATRRCSRRRRSSSSCASSPASAFSSASSPSSGLCSSDPAAPKRYSR